MLPHESDSESEEPLPCNSFTLHQSSQVITSEDSDSSYEECIAQGIIIDNHTNKNNLINNNNNNLVLDETSTGRGRGAHHAMTGQR